MFTGIIEEVGKVEYLMHDSTTGRIAIQAKEVVKDTKIGDSIAVNGVCLTVVQFSAKGFVADVMPETIRRTNLKNLKSMDLVNLERAMPANGRFGGHLVSGHVDGTGVITSMKREENAVWVTMKTSKEILEYIVCKGSICIDGISLTVAKVSEQDFSVSIIPHTGSETTLLQKKTDMIVNLETDMVGKYVRQFLGLTRQNTEEKKQDIHLLEFLQSNGF